MGSVIHDIMLRANTALFAQNVCRTLRDLTGNNFEISASSLQKGFYQSRGNLAAFMHFVSEVQGDFILTTEGHILKSIYSSVLTNGICVESDDFDELVSELLNVAVGATIPEIEKRLGAVTLIPPAIVNGLIRFPSILSGNVDIKCKDACIRCTLSINLAQLRKSQYTPLIKPQM